MDLTVERRVADPRQPRTESFEIALSNASVLAIDDEPGMRNFLYKTLSGPCRRVDVTADTDEASALLDERAYDVIVLDNIMPKKGGLEWLAEQQQIGLFSDAILMTAYADLDTAIAAIRAGASDFLLKPFRSNQILNAIAQSLDRVRLRRQNAVLRHELEAGTDPLRHRDALLGASDQIDVARRAIERAATTSAHVVIRGEPGTGKQIAARMLHSHSERRSHPFLWLQCYGLDEDGFRARLFGRLVDSSSGDQVGGDGMLLDASGGTLFLEDVELLAAPCQNLLNELLTTGRFSPIGAKRSLPFDVRIICSNTRALEHAVADRSFRADLYYRLNVVEIVLPPLRERTDDIVELTEFFCNQLASRMGLATPELPQSVRRRLLAHSWPGNVMELRNTVERALIHGDFEMALGGRAATDETESLAAVEQRHILTVLEACDGNRAEAARRLGVARKTIDRKCQSWGL
ncbi:MAG: sigma-54 dependent transcriptional regulator [Pseudomonadota bacterium]